MVVEPTFFAFWFKKIPIFFYKFICQTQHLYGFSTQVLYLYSHQPSILRSLDSNQQPELKLASTKYTRHL